MTFSIKKIHDKCYRYATAKWSGWLLFVVAFADAAALSIPLPIILLGMIMLNPAKAYHFAAFVVAGLLAGGVVGYYIGHFLWLTPSGEFTSLAKFVFDNVPGVTAEVYQSIQQQFEKWDFWLLFIISFVPAPQTLVTIFAGVFDINILIFIMAALICQSLKFFTFAWAVVKFGPRVKALLEYNYKPIAIVVSAALVAAVVVYKLT